MVTEKLFYSLINDIYYTQRTYDTTNFKNELLCNPIEYYKLRQFLYIKNNNKNSNLYRKGCIIHQKNINTNKKVYFIQSFNIIFLDNLGQISFEEIYLYDIILQYIRDSSTFMGRIIL